MFQKTCKVVGWIFASLFPFIVKPEEAWDSAHPEKTIYRVYEPDTEEMTTAFEVGNKTKDGFEVTAINGVRVNLEWAQKHANYLSSVLGDRKVTFIHNPTQGFRRDFYRYCLEAFGSRVTPAAERLKIIWEAKIAQGKTVIHLPHSEGCAVTYIALNLLKPEDREKINVVAIAPGKYISKSLCKEVVNIRCENDPVTWFHWESMLNAFFENTVDYVPHNGLADLFKEHYIYFKPYRERIQFHVNRIINTQAA